MPDRFTKENILKFLREISVMSIAVNLDNKPISSVVAFAVDNDFSFYFVTKRNTYKDQALQQNPQISLSVWEHNNMLVQASGKVREIADQQEMEETMKTVLRSLAHFDNFWWPVLNLKGGEYVSYKIQTEWLRVLDMSNKTGEGEERFFQIEI